MHFFSRTDQSYTLINLLNFNHRHIHGGAHIHYEFDRHKRLLDHKTSFLQTLIVLMFRSKETIVSTKGIAL